MAWRASFETPWGKLLETQGGFEGIVRDPSGEGMVWKRIWGRGVEVRVSDLAWKREVWQKLCGKEGAPREHAGTHGAGN